MSNKLAKVKAVKATEVEVAVKATEVHPIELSKDQMKVFKDLQTKSARIRYLASEGFATGDIARYLNIRYQHVRNVRETPLKRGIKAATNV